MYLYKDIVSGDEMISDSFALVPLKAYPNLIFEVEAKNIVKTEGDYGIGNNDEADGGPLAADSVTVINVVDAHNLQQMPMDKKYFMGWIKSYMAKVKTHLDEFNKERVTPFQQEASAFVKGLLGEFDEYTFYSGESMNQEGGLAFMRYKEDGTPIFFYFRDGLKVEKC
eukprot:TRINITY_DN770_c0_g2_i1.p1 TRINITY_DN770_c0_g2~~TRINITY_DN770_c0_g2_i1.p1  ORF type:complete len:184 (-),score=66.86 TRINITY_DN770_c0_g2_i1:190-693(-)